MTTNIWGLILKVVTLHAMKAYRRSGITPLVLNLSTTCSSVSKFTSQLLYSQWKNPVNWVGLRASVDTLKNRNISWPCRGSNPTPSPDCRLVTALTMQFHLLRPDISTWSIWMVISDVTWPLCHSTYVSLNETEHSKMQLTNKQFNHVLFQVFTAVVKMLGIFGVFTVYWDLFLPKSEEHALTFNVLTFKRP